MFLFERKDLNSKLHRLLTYIEIERRNLDKIEERIYFHQF